MLRLLVINTSSLSTSDYIHQLAMVRRNWVYCTSNSNKGEGFTTSQTETAEWVHRPSPSVLHLAVKSFTACDGDGYWLRSRFLPTSSALDAPIRRVSIKILPKNGMVWLPDGEKNFKIYLFVLTESKYVTDRHRMMYDCSSLSVRRCTILLGTSYHPICCCKYESRSEISWVDNRRSATHSVVIWRPFFCDGRPACVEQATITPPSHAVCRHF